MKVKTWVCSVCGYVYKGEVPPEECPVCHAPADKFVEQEEEMTAAFEEAEHAAKFAELLGEVVSPSTKENLTVRVAAENGATAGKVDLAKRAKELNLDAIHDTVHEMARDEARHGKAFAGLLKRYFG